METNIESHLIEKRVFKPAKEFAKKARGSNRSPSTEKCTANRCDSPDKFWAREAKELVWQKPWKKVLDWKAPFAKWFVGGQLNLSENCLDRHLARSTTKQSGHHLGRRAGRQTHSHLPAITSRSLPFRQRPEAKQNSQRRSRHHLSADDSRKRRSRCWPARASARCIRLFSADSALKHSRSHRG